MQSTMMKKSLAVLALGSLGLMTSGAQADWNHDGHDHGSRAIQQSNMFVQQINARQRQQMDRIQAGRRTGSLTRSEFDKLLHEQREIRAMEQHFRADGLIDPREFKRLDRALNIASQNIRAEKHDRQARVAYNPWFN
jgi:hypothetical protein